MRVRIDVDICSCVRLFNVQCRDERATRHGQTRNLRPNATVEPPALLHSLLCLRRCQIEHALACSQCVNGLSPDLPLVLVRIAVVKVVV